MTETAVPHRSEPAPGWLALTGLAAIRAQGPEARAFLQNQLTNDAAKLSPKQGQLSGYCSPKGRLLAVFAITCVDAETFLLSLPAGLLAPTLKRLKMFVLRSKLVLDDVSASLPALGLIGEAGAQALERRGLLPAAGDYAARSLEGVTALRLPGAAPRFLLRANAEWLTQFREGLELPELTPARWQATELLANTPTVWPETVDHFVPQTVDLDAAGGVSFTKGCYPGQEIVARVHYLGRLKSRLHRASVAAPATPGMAIHVAGGDGQAVGEVVDVAALAEGGSELLLTLNLSHTGSAQLRLGSVEGPALSAPRLAHPPASE